MKWLSRSLALLLCSSFAVHAESSDPLVWLQRATLASHQLNYSGTFVYRHGDQVETSRITHRVGEGVEQEKLEALDGPPKVIIRNNDQVVCYLQGKHAVKLERRDSRKLFPDVLPNQISTLTESYNVKLGEQERVAGYDSRVILLEPKDAYRYGHKLWSDTHSGLLLRTSMLNEKGQTIDQFSFTQLTIGGPIGKDQFLPQNPEAGQQVVEHMGPARRIPQDTGWVVTQLPAGFKKILELQRTMPGRKAPVAHLVYSDGLVAVSLFIEPKGRHMPSEGMNSQGAINIYTRYLGDYQVTAVGEVPPITVTQFAHSLTPKSPQ